MEELKRAKAMAKRAHKGQKDKGGEDYFLHPEKVASLVETEEEKIVAYLHDVVEDTEISMEMLEEYFSVSVTEAIELLTKKEGQDYEEYLRKIGENPLARTVKIADMTHNSEIYRISKPKEEDYIRREKYLRGIEILKKYEIE